MAGDEAANKAILNEITVLVSFVCILLTVIAIDLTSKMNMALRQQFPFICRLFFNPKYSGTPLYDYSVLITVVIN